MIDTIDAKILWYRFTWRLPQVSAGDLSPELVHRTLVPVSGKVQHTTQSLSLIHI